MKTTLVLLAEISGLLIVFLTFLLILNYFNVISLSSLYPKQLGFIPHAVSISNNPSINTNNAPSEKISGPSEKISLGKIIAATDQGIVLSSLGKTNEYLTFSTSNDSILEQQLTTSSAIQSYSGADLKNILNNNKAHLATVIYIQDGIIKLVKKITLLK
jgi:uncharacterized membrane protein